MVDDLAGNEIARMMLRKKAKIHYIPHDSAFSNHVPQLSTGYLHFCLGRNVYAIGMAWRDVSDRLYIKDNDGRSHDSAFSEWSYLPVSKHLIDTLKPYVAEKRDQYDRQERANTLNRALRA